MNSMKRQNDRILKEKLPRSIGAQYATGDKWRNNSRNNEGMEPKQKEYPAVDVTGDRSKVRYDYTVEVKNRFKGLDLIDRVPDELWNEVRDIVQETGIKTIPIEKKCKKQNGCLERPYK